MPPHSFSLGQRIRELRIKKGLTQIDLAKGLCTPSMISQIESDRARPSYRILMAIAERLDVPLDKLLENVDLNAEAMSRYKLARAMVAAKQYQPAIPLLRDLLGERTSFPMTDIQLGLAECYLQTEQADAAEAVLKEVYDTAVIRGEAQLLGVALHHLGMLHYYRKKYQVAAYNWLRALEQVEKQPAEEQDLSLKSNVLTMLGYVHLRIGLLREALLYFQEAAALQQEEKNLQELAQGYLEQGQAHQRVNDFVKSAEYSERAYAIFHSVEDWASQAKLDMTIAVQSALPDNHEDIISRLQAVVERFHTLGRQEEVGVAYAELAKLQLQFGDVTEAEKACETAQGFLSAGHPYAAELHQVRGQIAFRYREFDQAIQWFQQAAESYWEAGELAQWGDVLQESAQVYAQMLDYRRAYEVLVALRMQWHQALLERGVVL